MAQKILLFLDSSSFGGIESHVKTLAIMLNKYCPVKVLLWRQYKHEHLLMRQLAELNIETEVLDGSLRRLASLLTERSDTVLHCHGYKANLIGRFLAALCRVRCVCTFHNGDRGEGVVRFYTWLDETTSLFSRNIAVSKDIGKRLKGACSVIANSVMLPENWLSSVEQDGAVAFVGRVEQVKRPDRFCALARQLPDRQFAIWGDGALRTELAAKCTDNVNWHGAVESMASYWQQIDILVICSDYEGFPMVALEAMASGVPVLALPLGDLPRLITHGINGFIAQNEAQIQQHLQMWFNLSTTDRQMIRQQARQRISQDFNIDNMWPVLAAIYA